MVRGRKLKCRPHLLIRYPHRCFFRLCLFLTFLAAYRLSHPLPQEEKLLLTQVQILVLGGEKIRRVIAPQVRQTDHEFSTPCLVEVSHERISPTAEPSGRSHLVSWGKVKHMWHEERKRRACPIGPVARSDCAGCRV